ncbi:MAG: AarF/UbiB family protein [Chloroflexota bacterium]|nr:AarF/UbiB family protein [Chloroflexota bacterium]
MTNDIGFEYYQTPKGLVRRYFQTLGQLSGLFYGYSYSYVQERKAAGTARALKVLLLRFYLFIGWPFVDRNLVQQPFNEQFRVRLERMGPTYIKLGQILSLREDLLPKALTDELKNLLTELPAVSFDRYVLIIEEDLDRPVEEMFASIDPEPLGSASLAQTHRAWLKTGEDVALKVLKPGVRETVEMDTKLLRFYGWWLQLFLSRFQPAQLINEFSRYTLLEVDLRNEATNAEVFSANFSEEPDIRFPEIYREFSNRDVLCMEFFEGRMPNAETAVQLNDQESRKVVDLGVQAIIEMIFRDAFFHADLHPGNLIIFEDASVGFIDMGMVGRFDRATQRLMLYYMYSLAQENPADAARYLTAMAQAGRGSDVAGFRRAVEDLSTRWLRTPTFHEFSLGQLILESVLLAGKYRIVYPGEIILMVKALITVEGVGNQLVPDVNVTDVSRKHVRQIIFHRLNIVQIAKDSLLVLPELIEVMQRSPLVINQGLEFLESRFKTKESGPLTDALGTIFGVGLVIAAAIMALGDVSPIIWGGLIVLAFMSAGVDLIRK